MQATYPSAITPYPVRVEGHLGQPSRWSWLVKWFLALPHLLVLAVLWPAFVASSVAAFLAVLFTGRYPRSLFDFNVGVMRWSWRVAFYAYAANGTDLYAPFTLADLPDYPARLEVAYPEHQRQGWPLIGWWLAGIPQYLIVGVLMGGGLFGGAALGGVVFGGLIGLLVLIAAVMLLFRGTYPRSIFDLVLGLDRWVLRVVAYAAVMTPEYPPFRLDAGENDLAGAMNATPSAYARSNQSTTWSTPRITATVLASIAGLLGPAAIAAGATATGFDQTQRDASGYLMTGPAHYSTSTYALMSGSYPAGIGGDRFVARDLLGTIHLRAQSSRPVFVGIAPAGTATTYLAGVAHAQAGGLGASSDDFRVHSGGAPVAPPTAQRFWVASAAGAGARTLSWKVRPGSWRAVVMNADGSRSVAADLSIGASVPRLLTIGIAGLSGGILIVLLSAGGLYLVVRRTR